MCQKSTAHEQRRSRGESRKLRFGSNRTAPKIWQEGQHDLHSPPQPIAVDENTPLEQSTIETCLQEAYKYQKVMKISCDIWSRFEASWLDCVTMMSEMTIEVIVVSASCHHLTRADSGWSRISWFSRVTLPWLRGGTSGAPWRHKSSHVPVFRRLFDRLPVRISTSDLHHRIQRKKLYHIRAYDFGVQFSFKGQNQPIHQVCRSSKGGGQAVQTRRPARSEKHPCCQEEMTIRMLRQQLCHSRLQFPAHAAVLLGTSMFTCVRAVWGIAFWILGSLLL